MMKRPPEKTKDGSENRTRSASPEGQCLVRSILGALRDNPSLRALQVDPATGRVSAATLGRPAPSGSSPETSLESELRFGQACKFLQGQLTCSTCRHPLSSEELTGTKIEHSPEGITVSRATCPTAPRFWHWRTLSLPRLVARELTPPDEHHDENEWKHQLASVGACALLGLLAYSTPNHALSIGLYLAAFAFGAWHAATEVFERIQHGTLDVHFLMLAVAAGSAAIGAWSEGAMLLFLFSLSGALETFAEGRTQREIRSLVRNAPKTATVLTDPEGETSLPVDELQPGMRLLIRPGDLFPVDSEIVAGTTAADESNLTGESIPVEKQIGDTVLAGTINLWGAVEAVALRAATESALQRIIHLIREAQHLKAPSQRFTDRFGTHYTYAILSLSILMFFVWWLVLGRTPWVSGASGPSAFYRAMTLLVVASPCALVLSIPSAILAAIAWAARRGILFRGGSAIENLAEIDTVALDKTGTLTTGELRVENVESVPQGQETRVAQLAYSLEKLSNHPLARAVTRHGKQNQLVALELQNFQSVTGLGLRAELDGTPVQLGRRGWTTGTPPLTCEFPNSLADPGISELIVATDGLKGRILLRDEVRPASRQVVAALRALGLKTVVLTGDRKSVADQLQSEMCLDEIRSELTPEQKVQAIVSLHDSGHRVAMVGDGVNDAPCLAVAHVAIAMGARGSDSALEQADVVLMHDRLENVLAAVQISRVARRVIRQNVILSLTTAAVLAIFALAGAIPLTLGVLGHEGSTVLVVLNSLRLLFVRRPTASPG
jgi:Zn2+/Cd2+-exporting ATPase